MVPSRQYQFNKALIFQLIISMENNNVKRPSIRQYKCMDLHDIYINQQSKAQRLTNWIFFVTLIFTKSDSSNWNHVLVTPGETPKHDPQVTLQDKSWLMTHPNHIWKQTLAIPPPHTILLIWLLNAVSFADYIRHLGEILRDASQKSSNFKVPWQPG